MRKSSLPIVLSLTALTAVESPSPKAAGVVPAKINSVQTIIADMQPPHAGMPHGVPKHFDWAQGPRIGIGNNPKNFRAMTAWGQIYEAAEGNPAVNSRVEIRNIKAYLLSKRDRRWHLLQSSKLVEGEAYREDFAGDLKKRPDIRYEKGGSVSVKAGGGFNFHFWAKTGRAAIDPNDVAGIFTTVQARLIEDNPKRPHDLARARYLLSMGGDYWSSQTATWSQFATNGDIAIGKFKYVTPMWQAFNMTTLTAAQIRQNPPPLE